MASTWLFFRPARLPLAPHELDATTVLTMADDAAVRDALAQAFADLVWESAHAARATHEGQWLEWRLPQAATSTLSLRCSLRADHAVLAQSLCDRFGWLAFDEQALCFQPHRDPMKA